MLVMKGLWTDRQAREAYLLSQILLKVSLHFRDAKSLNERETQTVLSRAPAAGIQHDEKLV